MSGCSLFDFFGERQQGSHGCKGCQNPITWDPKGGLEFDNAAKEEIYEQLEKSYVAGITFSGGDPLYKGNVSEITAFAKEIKEKYPKKTILEQSDISLKWKGSANQRVINVKKSLETGSVVLHA